MGIMDFIKGELIEVIEWTDDSRDTLSYRFPDDDKAIKKRLEEMRSELLKWGENDPHGTRAGTVYSPSSYRSHTKDELRGWIAALEWVGSAGAP